MTADPTNAVRKQRMREKRKRDGLTEVRVWLEPRLVRRLDDYVAHCGGDRAKAAIEFIKACP